MKEQLLSADILSNGLIEDVYLITPNNSGDGSVQIALTHLSKPGRKPGMPVILIHGQFSNRSVWFNYNGSNYAEFLTGLGYDVWMPEMRGHGLSPENQRFHHNSLLDYINYDLPALQEYVSTRVEEQPVWFGYGLSGVALSMALAGETLNRDLISGVVLLGLDDPRGAWRKRRMMSMLAWRARKRGYIEADAPSGCPEPEAYGILHGNTNPLRPTTKFTGYSQQKDFKNKITDIKIPLLMLAGPEEEVRSSLDAHKIFQCWGGSQKNFLRYSNANTEQAMICSQHARSHLWKDTEMWLSSLSHASIDYVETA